VFASDLNPVATLILNTMLVGIPRGGPDLVERLERAARRILQQMDSELADLFPASENQRRPVAYLWARSVRCETPNCGAEIPLVRSFWLSTRKGAKTALRAIVIKSAEGPPTIALEVFQPARDADVASGTIRLAKAKCLACHTVLPPERLRSQMREQHGGADTIFDPAGNRLGGARLLAVVSERMEGRGGKLFREPTAEDYRAVRLAQERVIALHAGPSGLNPVPDEPVSQDGTGSVGGGYRTRKYGIERFGQFFSARQKFVYASFAGVIADLQAGDDVLKELLALALDKVIDFNCSLSKWRPAHEDIGDLFGRQALPMVWDYVETNVLARTYVGFERAVSHAAKVISFVRASTTNVGNVQVADARYHPLPAEAAEVFFIDPPYYDAVPYADLADFFFVWLKRALPGHPLLRDPFMPENRLTPKAGEIVRDEVNHLDGRPKKTHQFYEKEMGAAFAEGLRLLKPDGIGCVVFAHKTTEGWEALLGGMIKGGWIIVGSWPIATEMSSRLRARESAALATSVHLVCRPRPANAPVGDWGNVLRELPKRVGDWMERLQSEGIRGADLVFACIGPALEIFSRYSGVETADGREVKLAEYLEKVWEVVGRAALEQVLGTAEAKARNGAAGAVEEDARLTALFLWTLQSTNGGSTGTGTEDTDVEEDSGADEEEETTSHGKAKGYSLVFDVVRRFAQPLGIELSNWEGRVIETKKGVVRLLPIAERAKQLFGEDGAQAVAARLEQQVTVGTNPLQGMLFPDMRLSDAPAIRTKRGRVDLSDESLAAASEATTLDRVHAAMLLQAGGRTNALRALLKAEQERGPDFLRLANAFSALYPKGSEEKRLIDAMLLAVPR